MEGKSLKAIMLTLIIMPLVVVVNNEDRMIIDEKVKIIVPTNHIWIYGCGPLTITGYNLTNSSGPIRKDELLSRSECKKVCTTGEIYVKLINKHFRVNVNGLNNINESDIMISITLKNYTSKEQIKEGSDSIHYDCHDPSQKIDVCLEKSVSNISDDFNYYNGSVNILRQKTNSGIKTLIETSGIPLQLDIIANCTELVVAKSNNETWLIMFENVSLQSIVPEKEDNLKSKNNTDKVDEHMELQHNTSEEVTRYVSKTTNETQLNASRNEGSSGLIVVVVVAVVVLAVVVVVAVVIYCIKKRCNRNLLEGEEGEEQGLNDIQLQE